MTLHELSKNEVVWAVVVGVLKETQTMGRRKPLSRFMFGVNSKSGWLPQFSPARTLPSWCSSCFIELEQWYCFGVPRFTACLYFQCPLGFSHVYLCTILTWNLVHHTCLLLLRDSLFFLHQSSDQSLVWRQASSLQGHGLFMIFLLLAPDITGEPSSCYASWMVMG